MSNSTHSTLTATLKRTIVRELVAASKTTQSRPDPLTEQEAWRIADRIAGEVGLEYPE